MLHTCRSCLLAGCVITAWQVLLAEVPFLRWLTRKNEVRGVMLSALFASKAALSALAEGLYDEHKLTRAKTCGCQVAVMGTRTLAFAFLGFI